LTVFSVPVDKIFVSGNNPRSTFDEESLKSLAESIKVHGLLQPILVRPRNGDEYELVVGERRLRATKLLGVKTILAKVQDVDDSTCFELRLIENTHREDLTDAEKGDAVYGLMEAYPEKYPTIASVAEAINKPYNTVAEKWCKKARKLSDYVKSSISRDELTEKNSLLLLKYPHQTQDKLAKQIVKHEMTYEQARQFCRLYDENPLINLNELAEKAKGIDKVEIDVSKLTPKARKEVEDILKKKKEAIEEERKQSLKKARKAPRRPRPSRPKKRNKKKSNKTPTKPSTSIFDEDPSEGIVFTTTIPTDTFRQLTDLAQELGSNIHEAIQHIVTKFFEWRKEHEQL